MLLFPINFKQTYIFLAATLMIYWPIKVKTRQWFIQIELVNVNRDKNVRGKFTFCWVNKIKGYNVTANSSTIKSNKRRKEEKQLLSINDMPYSCFYTCCFGYTGILFYWEFFRISPLSIFHTAEIKIMRYTEISHISRLVIWFTDTVLFHQLLLLRCNIKLVVLWYNITT